MKAFRLILSVLIGCIVAVCLFMIVGIALDDNDFEFVVPPDDVTGPTASANGLNYTTIIYSSIAEPSLLPVVGASLISIIVFMLPRTKTVFSRRFKWFASATVCSYFILYFLLWGAEMAPL